MKIHAEVSEPGCKEHRKSRSVRRMYKKCVKIHFFLDWPICNIFAKFEVCADSDVILHQKNLKNPKQKSEKNFVQFWAQKTRKTRYDFLGVCFNFSHVKWHLNQHKLRILRKYCKLVNLEKNEFWHIFCAGAWRNVICDVLCSLVR